MTYEQQRNRELAFAAERKRRKKRRDNIVAWCVLLGGVLVIFALGVLFGWHLTSHAQTGQATPVTSSIKADAKSYTEQPTAMIELSSPTESLKGVPGLSLDYELQKAMYDSCQKYDVPFALALAVAEKESNFNPNAVSRTDDHGIMQINTCNFEYLRDCGIEPLTHKGNIEAGVMLLGENLELYGDEGLALMAYNCGRTGAKRLWDAGTYSTAYSRAVMELYEKWLGVLEVQ